VVVFLFPSHYSYLSFSVPVVFELELVELTTLEQVEGCTESECDVA
jgi:hypothetical protein